jgi:hypothetical protein
MGGALQPLAPMGPTDMPEVLFEFSAPVTGPAGRVYDARAVGSQRADGLWHAWIEFSSASEREVLATDRETTQPNRADAVYWATGLTPIYLEGALARALDVSRSRHAAQHLQTHSS